MTAEFATAQFDDGSENLCLILTDDDGHRHIMDVDDHQALALLQEHDLDAYDAVMSLVHVLLERSLSVGMEA